MQRLFQDAESFQERKLVIELAFQFLRAAFQVRAAHPEGDYGQHEENCQELHKLTGICRRSALPFSGARLRCAPTSTRNRYRCE